MMNSVQPQSLAMPLLLTVVVSVVAGCAGIAPSAGHATAHLSDGHASTGARPSAAAATAKSAALKVEPAAADAVRPRRQAALVADYERRRARAQLMAAKARWQQNDWDECELLLEELLARFPDQREARELLVHVMLQREDVEGAEYQLRQMLTYHDIAEVHHQLAVLLETQDRVQDAAVHFRRATELEPDNPLYQIHDLRSEEK